MEVPFKPYYQDDSCTIYNADCTEIGSAIVFDALVTDPPYGMNFQSNRRTKQHIKIHGDNAFPVDVVVDFIARAKVASYVFCRWDNIKEMPTPKSVVVWVKNNWSMGDLKHEHGRMWEACLFYPGPSHEFNKRIPDVIEADRTGSILHPTQKPVSVFERLMLATKADLFFDPFLGSGSSAVAAKQCGKKLIGIEINEKYCEIAAKRLEQGVLF